MTAVLGPLCLQDIISQLHLALLLPHSTAFDKRGLSYGNGCLLIMTSFVFLLKYSVKALQPNSERAVGSRHMLYRGNPRPTGSNNTSAEW